MSEATAHDSASTSALELRALADTLNAEMFEDDRMPSGMAAWFARIDGRVTFVFGAGMTAADRLDCARQILALAVTR